MLLLGCCANGTDDQLRRFGLHQVMQFQPGFLPAGRIPVEQGIDRGFRMGSVKEVFGPKATEINPAEVSASGISPPSCAQLRR